MSATPHWIQNNLNQIKRQDITPAGGATTTWRYSFDSNGRMTQKTDGGSQVFTYTWDPDEPRLTRVQGPGGIDVSYSYDSAGRMLTRVSGGVSTTFEWDGWTLVKETTGSVVTRYVAPQGQLHSFERGGQVYQVHSDGHNGSVRAITNASGAVVAHYEFDAWGAQLGSSSPFSGGFSFGYVGSLGVRTDATTGLLYMRHRWFDPNGLQRFRSRDVLGSLNRYEYCYNDPVNWVDLDGLQPSLPPGWTMTTQSGGVNSYSNPGSLTQLPGHLPPGWNMETQPDGVHAYDNYPRVKLDVKVPDIETPKLPKFKLGDCPDLEEPLSVPGIPLEWPPRDRFPRPNYDPIDPYSYPNEYHPGRIKRRRMYRNIKRHQWLYLGGLAFASIGGGVFRSPAATLMGVGFDVALFAQDAWDAYVAPEYTPDQWK